MAKKKELLMRDILMKMEKFLKDAYIIHGKCFIDGEDSKRTGIGWVCGVLNDDATTVMRNAYPVDVINIINVRNAKDRPEEFVKEVVSPDAEKIESECTNLYEHVRACSTWTPFSLSNEDVSNIFDKAERINYEFIPGHPVQISKSLFPTITTKSVNTVEYTAEFIEDIDFPENTIGRVIVKLPGDFYTAFIEYMFMV